MAITTDTENIFDKNPISIPSLNLHKVGTKGNFLNMINGIYRKNLLLTSHLMLEWFPLKRSELKKAVLTTSIKHYTGCSSQCNKARKIKGF